MEGDGQRRRMGGEDGATARLGHARAPTWNAVMLKPTRSKNSPAGLPGFMRMPKAERRSRGRVVRGGRPQRPGKFRTVGRASGRDAEQVDLRATEGADRSCPGGPARPHRRPAQLEAFPATRTETFASITSTGFRRDAPPDDWVVVDCIEFNDRFRHADPIAEVAFLAMELTLEGRGDLADTFVEAYLRASGDQRGPIACCRFIGRIARRFGQRSRG